MSTAGPSLAAILDDARSRAEASGAFGAIGIKSGRLVCHARASASPASYRIFEDGGRLWVALVMADRWLSGSIETDLLHTGDKVEDLIEEELVELGLTGHHPVVEHFRSDDLLFTFRTPLPQRDAATAAAFLLAYEACFRRLGDMEAGSGD